MGMSAAQFLQAVKSLLPPGAAWRVETGGPLDGVLAAWADEAARVDDRVDAALTEADPRSAAELLVQWEAVVGLPDSASPVDQSLDMRRVMAHGRLADDGNVSGPGWIARAARLGHTVTLAEFAPSRAGVMRAGDQLAPQEAVFVLGLTVTVSGADAARAGAMQAGDALGSWSSARFEHEMNRKRQGHTQLLFNYI